MLKEDFIEAVKIIKEHNAHLQKTFVNFIGLMENFFQTDAMRDWKFDNTAGSYGDLDCYASFIDESILSKIRHYRIHFNSDGNVAIGVNIIIKENEYLEDLDIKGNYDISKQEPHKAAIGVLLKISAVDENFRTALTDALGLEYNEYIVSEDKKRVLRSDHSVYEFK